MKPRMFIIIVACVATAVVAQQGPLAEPQWRHKMQTDELHTVYCNFCEALNTTPTPAIGVTPLKTPSADATPGAMVIQAGVDYCPAVASDPNACPIVSSGTKNCVKIRLQPAVCPTPGATKCRNGNVYQLHWVATAASGDVLDCDLRLDVADKVYNSN